jgi:hypothetical protein
MLQRLTTVGAFYLNNYRYLYFQINKKTIMAKSQDAKKNTKKEPLKTAKEKKEEKREKKNITKRD